MLRRLEHLARAAAADAFAVLLMHPEASGGDDEGSEAGEGSGEDGGGGDEASVSVVGAAAQGDSGGGLCLQKAAPSNNAESSTGTLASRCMSECKERMFFCGSSGSHNK